MKFIGRQINVGIGREITRGTGVVPAFWTPNIGAEVEDKIETVADEATRGIIEDAVGIEVVKRWAEGNIVGNVRDRSFGLLLLSALGQVASVARTPATPVARDHTFTILQSAIHQSLTLSMRNPVQQLRFALAVINSLEIRCELAKHVEFTANFLSRLGTMATDAVSYVVENQFLAHHIEIRLAADLVGLGTAAPIRVRAANLSIAKNVESDDILGSIEPSDYVNKQVEITGNIELLYEDTTFKSLFLGGTSRAMRIDIRNPGVVLETGVNPQLRIELARVQFPEWTRAGALNDIVSQSLAFKALYSLADAQAIRVILTNTQATY